MPRIVLTALLALAVLGHPVSAQVLRGLVLDGVRVRPEHVSALSLDMVEVLVVLAPGESPAYTGGAVLLYTAGWIG